MVTKPKPMRIGNFDMDARWVHDHPDEAARIFKELSFVPVRAEMHFCGFRIQYTGLSELFEIQPAGTPAPEYRLLINKNEDGSVSLKEVQKIE